MKNFIKFIFFAFILTSTAYSFGKKATPKPCSPTKNNINVSVSQLYSQSPRFRRIYGMGIMYRLEMSRCLSRKFEFWINSSYLQEPGKSVPLQNSTKIQLIPLSLGLSYIQAINPKFNLHLGLGPCYTWLKIKNNSPFVRNLKKSNAGGLFKTELIYKSKGLFLSLFLNYYLQYFYFPGKSFAGENVLYNSEYVGGLIFGLGIGKNF